MTNMGYRNIKVEDDVYESIVKAQGLMMADLKRPISKSQVLREYLRKEMHVEIEGLRDVRRPTK